MTDISILEAPRALESRILDLRERSATLKTFAGSTVPDRTQMTSKSSYVLHGAEEALILAADIDAEIEKLIKEQDLAVTESLKLINTVENPDYHKFLIKYYLEYKSNKEIAVEMHLSERYVRKLRYRLINLINWTANDR